MAKITRRHAAALVAGVAAASLLRPRAAGATPARVADEIASFTRGAPVTGGGITLDLPQLADSGLAVPVGVRVEADTAGAPRLRTVRILADGNPSPGVATFNVSDSAGIDAVRTRIRLAQSQTVTAVAELSDGSFRSAARRITVTAGGCG